MSFHECSMISLEEVNKDLEEIENKYSPVKKCDLKNDIKEELLILSKVFFCAGFSELFYICVFFSGIRYSWTSNDKSFKS